MLFNLSSSIKSLQKSGGTGEALNKQAKIIDINLCISFLSLSKNKWTSSSKFPSSNNYYRYGCYSPIFNPSSPDSIIFNNISQIFILTPISFEFKNLIMGWTIPLSKKFN